jgi:hypothetical protein
MRVLIVTLIARGDKFNVGSISLTSRHDERQPRFGQTHRQTSPTKPAGHTLECVSGGDLRVTAPGSAISAGPGERPVAGPFSLQYCQPGMIDPLERRLPPEACF